MALQFNRGDASTGHQWTVYARIDKATVILHEQTSIIMNLYDSIGAATEGLNPVLPPDIVTLNNDEMTGVNAAFVTALATAAAAGQILSAADALLTALYTLIKAKPGYSSAVDV